MLTSQFHDSFCSESFRRLERFVELTFKIYENRLLVRFLQDIPQNVVPHKLKNKVLHLITMPYVLDIPVEDCYATKSVNIIDVRQLRWTIITRYDYDHTLLGTGLS